MVDQAAPVERPATPPSRRLWPRGVRGPQGESTDGEESDAGGGRTGQRRTRRRRARDAARNTDRRPRLQADATEPPGEDGRLVDPMVLVLDPGAGRDVALVVRDLLQATAGVRNRPVVLVGAGSEADPDAEAVADELARRLDVPVDLSAGALLVSGELRLRTVQGARPRRSVPSDHSFPDRPLPAGIAEPIAVARTPVRRPVVVLETPAEHHEPGPGSAPPAPQSVPSGQPSGHEPTDLPASMGGTGPVFRPADPVPDPLPDPVPAAPAVPAPVAAARGRQDRPPAQAEQAEAVAPRTVGEPRTGDPDKVAARLGWEHTLAQRRVVDVLAVNPGLRRSLVDVEAQRCLVSLQAYVGGHAQGVDDVLRGSPDARGDVESALALARSAAAGLRTLPTATGPVLLARAQESAARATALAAYREALDGGRVLLEPGFLAASRSSTVAWPSAPPDQEEDDVVAVLFALHGPDGRQVRLLSPSVGADVLFPPGTRWSVLAVDEAPTEPVPVPEGPESVAVVHLVQIDDRTAARAVDGAVRDRLADAVTRVRWRRAHHTAVQPCALPGLSADLKPFPARPSSTGVSPQQQHDRSAR